MNSNFIEIDRKNTSAADLLKKLQNDSVLLEITYDPAEHTCSVTSYAYNRYRTLMVYSPIHTLCCLEGLTEIFFPEMDIRSSEEWTSRFLSGNYFLNIESESYSDCEYKKDIDQIRDLLGTVDTPRRVTELYLSNDHGNFYGPLEIDCMEWWIRNHPGYHTDTISHTVDGFEISEAGTLLDYTGENTDIDILPSGIKRIGRMPRSCRRCLRRITIPEGVEEIEFSAFEECTSLTEINFPSTLKRIAPYAFSGCTALETVVLPESLGHIGYHAFYGCKNLNSVILPNKTAAAFGAFSNCPEQTAGLSPKFDISKGHILRTDSDLEGHIRVPSGVSTINRNAFSNPGKISSLLLPKSLSKIESCALPNSLRYLLILPGKRTVNCRYDLLASSNLKLVFHIGRNLCLYRSFRWEDEELIFVSAPGDLLSVNRHPFEDRKNCFRYYISSSRDIETLADRFGLRENAEIMQYLTDISRSLPL